MVFAMVAWPFDTGFCDTKFKVIIIIVSNSLQNYAYIESGIIIWFGYLSLPWEYKMSCIWDPLVNSVFIIEIKLKPVQHISTWYLGNKSNHCYFDILIMLKWAKLSFKSWPK